MGGEVRYEYHGFTFTWDSTKAETNLKKHGVAPAGLHNSLLGKL